MHELAPSGQPHSAVAASQTGTQVKLVTDAPSSFGDSATRLSRNPLGVIALFIVLIEMFAAAVVGPFGDRLQPDHVWTLVIFLISFPVVVFATFTWLIVKHHTKLYSPSDYRSDEAFVSTLTQAEQSERISADVSEEAEVLPGKQSGPSKISSLPAGLAKHDYFLAEDLALRQLEATLGQSIRRNVLLKTDSESLQFDGVILARNGLTAVEVKLVRTAGGVTRVVNDTAHRFREMARHVKTRGKGHSFSGILVLVLASPDLVPDEVRSRATQLLQTDITVRLYVHAYSDLREGFGLPARSS